MRAVRFLSYPAAASLALAPIGESFAQTPPAGRDPLLIAADDYAAQKLNFDQARLNRIRDGLIVPGCNFVYPELSVQLAINGSNNQPVEHAAAAAMVKQNLRRLGIDDERAQAWADSYFADLRHPPPQPTFTVVQSPAMKEKAELAAPSVPHHPAAQVLGQHGHANAVAQVSPALTAALAEPAPPVGYTAAARLANRVNAAGGKPAGFPKILDPGDCPQALITTRATRYRIKPVPATGEVFYIAMFFFNLCVARQVDPYDRSRCLDWQLPDNDLGSKLIGTYMLQGHWPDGRNNQIKRTFDYQGDGPKTTTLGPKKN